MLVLTTYDWVPETPRGYVRDLRIRWALEEAGLEYRVESTPFDVRGSEHFSHQPFGQVPWLTDGDLSVFESGAILLYLAERSTDLMPQDKEGRAMVLQWLIAALNSVEMPSVPWSLFKFLDDRSESPGRNMLENFLQARLNHMDKFLASHEWLAGQFSVADIAMSDVLRLVDRFDGLASFPNCRDYVQRATARPAFKKAYSDQMRHFAVADKPENP